MTKKIISVVILISMLFNLRLTSYAANYNVDDYVSAVSDSVSSLAEYSFGVMSGQESKSFLTWLREIFGYYNIRNVNKLKKAISRKDDIKHGYTLKKDLVIDEQITIPGYFKLMGNKTITQKASDKSIFVIPKGGYFDIYDVTVKSSDLTFYNEGTMYMKNVKASSDGYVINNHGLCQIDSGTYTTNKDNVVALLLMENSTTRIYGGTFENSAGYDIGLHGPKATLNIYGGNAQDLLITSDHNNSYNKTGGTIGKVTYTNPTNPTPPTPSGKFMWPLPSSYRNISSPFGLRTDPITGQPGKLHGGIDLPAPKNTTIYAAESGTVVTATSHSSYGNYVVVKHSNNTYTLYAHCNSLNVSVGQTVSKGQTIAFVGTTGNSTGNHLHFEVRTGGNSSSNRVNPMSFTYDYK